MGGLGPSVVLVRKCKLLTLRCEANSMTKIPIWLVGQWYALNVREDLGRWVKMPNQWLFLYSGNTVQGWNAGLPCL